MILVLFAKVTKGLYRQYERFVGEVNNRIKAQGLTNSRFTLKMNNALRTDANAGLLNIRGILLGEIHRSLILSTPRFISHRPV